MIPCPGQHCSSGSTYSWICENCKGPVEYGHIDDYLYCNCGRFPYNGCAFKCKENRHGSPFARYDSSTLLKLLRKLEPFDEINVLILARPGLAIDFHQRLLSTTWTYDTLEEAMESKQPEVPRRIFFLLPV